MDVCRVQEARRRKGLADFPGKSVGIIEFETFAATIDPRIRTTCLQCPPDATPGQYCGSGFDDCVSSSHLVTPLTLGILTLIAA